VVGALEAEPVEPVVVEEAVAVRHGESS